MNLERVAGDFTDYILMKRERLRCAAALQESGCRFDG